MEPPEARHPVKPSELPDDVPLFDRALKAPGVRTPWRGQDALALLSEVADEDPDPEELSPDALDPDELEEPEASDEEAEDAAVLPFELVLRLSVL